MTERKTVRRVETCAQCDGDGCVSYVDDWNEHIPLTSWDIPCDDCEGKGFIWKDVVRADPRWAKQWKAEHHD